MALTLEQLRVAFATGDVPGIDNVDGYRTADGRDRRYESWYGRCAAVMYWLCAFVAGGAVRSYDPAWAAWQVAPEGDGIGGTSWETIPSDGGVFLYWDVYFNGSRDGHVGYLVPGTRWMLHGYSDIDIAWGTNLGLVNADDFQRRRGWKFAGWSRHYGRNAPVSVGLAPNQRTTASWEVGFRAFADLDRSHIAKVLAPGTVVDGIWWQFGDGGGSGEDRFLLVAHGGQQGYVHIGDVVQSGTAGIPEYEGQIAKPSPEPPAGAPGADPEPGDEPGDSAPDEPAPPVTDPQPNPIPDPEDPPAPDEPDAPEPTPDPEPTAPARPITQEDIMTLDNAIPKVSVADGALGSIIEKPATRKRVYSVWVILGLTLTAVTAGLIAGAAAAALAVGAGWSLPLVVGIAALAGVSGAYGALSPQMAMLARANTPSVGG